MLALVGLAAPASAALIGPPDPNAELARVCLTLRPSTTPLFCINL